MPGSLQGRAIAAVRQAIVTGELKPLTRMRCRDCGQPARHYHHHRGYEPEHWLTVMALCVSCHRLRHADEHRPPRPEPQFVVSTIRTPHRIYAELVALAKAERRSVNATMVIAFERYIRQMKARRPKDADR